MQCITEEKYSDLTSGGLPNNYSIGRIRKVLASVIIRRQVDWGPDRLCIVALGAGSRSVGGSSLSKVGNTVHDCHAEVLARRGLLRFMYSQLDKIKNSKRHESIFEKKGKKYALREDISLHLFISKPPCGDAAVFGLHDLHSNRLRRGIPRATPENGEGAVRIPEKDYTFKEYKTLQEARLHKMCCSAKIARWNVTGVQGALLSLYIEPVYFSSITIGSHFNEGHLRRAVYERVSKIKELRAPYHVNNPDLYSVSDPDDTNEKSHKMSLNWYLDYHDPGQASADNKELIECQSGRTHRCRMSRLSKRTLLDMFLSLWSDFAPSDVKVKAQQAMGGQKQCEYRYDQVKALAQVYQETKDKVAEHVRQRRYGGARWLKMPPEVDQFSQLDECSS